MIYKRIKPYRPLSSNTYKIASNMTDEEIIIGCISSLIDNEMDSILSLLEEIKAMPVVSTRSNKTGNRINMKVILNYRLITVNLYAAHKDELMFQDEFLSSLLDRLMINGKVENRYNHARYPFLVETIKEMASVKLRTCIHQWFSLDHDIIKWLIMVKIRQNSLGDGIRYAYEEYEKLVKSGSIERNRDKYYGERAETIIRKSSALAFDHGVTLKRVLNLVRESFVQGVLKS